MSFPGFIQWPQPQLETVFNHSILPVDGHKSVDSVSLPTVIVGGVLRPSIYGADPVHIIPGTIAMELHRHSLVKIDLRFGDAWAENVGLPVISAVNGIFSYSFGDPETVVSGIAGLRLYVHRDGGSMFSMDRGPKGKQIVSGITLWEAQVFAFRCFSAVAISRARMSARKNDVNKQVA